MFSREMGTSRLTNGDTLGMDGAEVSVFEQRHEVSLNGFLQGTDGRALETKVGLEILSDFSDEALEWQFADEELSGFLVATDFTESDGTYDASVSESVYVK